MKTLLLLSFVLLLQDVCSREHAIVVPKVFRSGATEIVAVNLHGYPVGTTVKGFLQELPTKQIVISNANGRLNNTDEPVLLHMKIDPTKIVPFRRNQKVRLTVVIANDDKNPITIDVHVSQESGYLFVTTDRPAYKPGENVRIKIFPLDQAMRPDTTSVTIIIRTPDGIGVDKMTRTLELGDSFIEDDYEISSVPELGLWIIEATYSANGYDTTAETKFKVDYYVLPTFQVKIDLQKKFVLVEDNHINVTIKAHYSYGKPVKGDILLIGQIKKTPNSKPIEFYKYPGNGLLWGKIRGGERDFRIPLSTISNKTGQNMSTLARNNAVIFIEISVNGEAEGVIESAISPDLRITKSPYVIDTARASPYFTPGLPYKLQVDVLHSIGREPVLPKLKVDISVDGGNLNSHKTGDHGQVNIGLNLNSNGNQNVVITTNVPGLKPQQQATATIKLTSYVSPSNNYLQVIPTKTYIEVGDSWQVTFWCSDNKEKIIRYLIVARGRIVAWGNKHAPQNTKAITADIRITQAMVPFARVVAYYLVGEEIVANSLWFDVVNQCKTPLSLIVPKEVYPGSNVDIKINGPSNAVVSLSGVDRAAYFLYNGSRLLPKNMFDKMGSYDQGCIRNGGRNARSVFLEAGFNVVTSSSSPAPYPGCSVAKPLGRKKRQVVAASKTLSDAKIKKCKESGKLPPIVPEDTCAMRKQRVEDFENDPECAHLFEKACKKRLLRILLEKIRGLTGRSSSDGRAEQISQKQLSKLRTNFEENIFFDHIKLSSDGKETFSALVSDSITTFEIDAVSVINVTDGFCVAQTKNLRVFKQLFIQLYTPYSLRKLEQANLRITVFNYDKTDTKKVTLQVFVKKGEPLCTFYIQGEWNKLIQFDIPPQNATSATFTVLPLQIPNNTGTVSVQVRAIDNHGIILDHVNKDILIEESGELLDSVASKGIDLLSNVTQTFNFTFKFPEDFVPGTRKCWLYAYVNFLGPSIEVDPLSKEPRDISSIFRMPYGCGEQTMLTSGPNVYTLMYLVAANKIIRGSPEYLKATAKIKSGFARELTYRSEKDGPNVWAVHPAYFPSTWLNAFVDKVFIKANNYTDIDNKPICDSLNWLVTKQHKDGYFVEDRKPFHREMQGAVGGKLSLTAYVVISLIESIEMPNTCTSQTKDLINIAVTRGVDFLTNNINNLIFREKPYAMALLSYALALRNPRSIDAMKMFHRLLNIKSEAEKTIFWEGRTDNIGGTELNPYWYHHRNAIDVEATAYALLAQIAMTKYDNPPPQTAIDRARKIVLWLIEQRNEGGAFISTQDTVIGLQALAQYEVWMDSLDISPKINNFNLSFTAPNTTWANGKIQLRLTDKQLKYRTELKVPLDVINHGSVDVVAKGVGEGVVSYRCVYRSGTDDEPCHFNISHNVTIVSKESAENMEIKLTLVILKSSGPPSGMAIVDVGLMSGFVPDKNDLQRMIKEENPDGVIDRYEITNFNVILYLNKITDDPLRLAFKMRQTVVVAKPEPAKINVYDYSEPFVRCGFFYNLPLDSIRSNLQTANCDNNKPTNNLCKCAEGGCFLCRTRNQQVAQTKCVGNNSQNCNICKNKTDESCINLYSQSCKRNYAYVVKITGVYIPSDDSVFYKLTAKILNILKKGDHVATVNDTINFIVRKDCYRKCKDELLQKNKAEYFKINRQLFVSGSQPDKVLGRNKEDVYQYGLDENAFVERYIPKNKCNIWAKKYKKCVTYYNGTRKFNINKPKQNKKKRRCDNLRKSFLKKRMCENYSEVEKILQDSSCDAI